jgi:hypothetical protein
MFQDLSPTKLAYPLTVIDRTCNAMSLLAYPSKYFLAEALRTVESKRNWMCNGGAEALFGVTGGLVGVVKVKVTGAETPIA